MPKWDPKKEMRIVVDHYTGFEGHPEYQFVAVSQIETRVFRMWSGWFDEIMQKVMPNEHGWTALALVYHLNEGWFETSPWQLKAVRPAMTQLQASLDNLPPGQTQDICRQLIEFLSFEHTRGAVIFIDYD